ncbi:hypothetical protein JY651_46950 [Pyxidicoccus parkwayensis]|uniref:Zinc ribbon domain-containing protein n=1 Tax=Pyxidicoccus parkwayensis TaxID=2813578 RepID=A0ABX7NUJ9_9BACT|nr:hypothetical protein [Pyxidicoccus parkwaysis]QSQ22572.1 hypothetical protein JY651_46950 [Pyxidicoccus parkwaysis]
MTSRHSRFLHLERARAERPEHETSSSLESSNRFESMQERQDTPQEAAVPETHLERFKGQEPVPLAPPPEEDARRFPRCMLCESENGRFAQTCRMCGADLGTPQQLDYNERLWQERKQGLTRTLEDEREALRQLETQRQQEAQRKREDEERFARQIAELRAKEQSFGWFRHLRQHATVGTALLSLIPNPRVRWLTLACVVGLALGLMRFGEGGTRLAGLGLAALLAVLFIPPGLLGRFR